MNSIASILAHDHGHCDVLFSHACAHARGARWPDAIAAVGALAQALDRHLTLEEELVFRAVDEALAGAPSPTSTLRAEHRTLQGVMTRLAQAAQLADASAFFKHAGTMTIVLHQHHEKEEVAFYPAAERILASRRAAIVEALEQAAAQTPGVFC